MKRFFKIIIQLAGILLIVVVVGFAVVYAIYNEPLPEGKSGIAADTLAEKMRNRLNYEAYIDTRFIEWSFAAGAHSYKWDKAKGIVVVKWADYTVNLNLADTSSSFANKKGARLSGKESRELSSTAWDYFNNDSFWLVAPFKVFDEGTERSIVALEDGSEGLLITYTSGGSTPGDSYLWKLNANGFPESYQMWVGTIPIGGLKASWNGWQIMESGIYLPTSHKLGPITLGMGDVKGYN